MRSAADRPSPAVIGPLGVLTIVAYGACYYAYGVLIEPISTDTGWSRATLGSLFGVVLLLNGAVGVVAGRTLDRIGPRPLFVAGALVGAGAMFLASFQAEFLRFAAAYTIGCGLVGALGFYHVTQAVAARGSSSDPARAIVRLTILGAFASPVFLPLTAWLVESVGWRATIRVEAASVAAAFIVAAVAGPHQAPRSTSLEPGGVALLASWKTQRMRRWLLATLIGGAAADVLLVYQVPAMVAAGLSLTAAATVAGVRGFAQLAGRLPLGSLLRRLGARRTLVLAYGIGAFAAVLLLGSGSLVVALLFSLFAGASLGAISSLQGIYTHELVDPRHLGMLLGAQQAVFGIGGAAGPLVAGALLGATGSYTATVLIAAVGFVAAGLILHPGRRHASEVALDAP